MKTEDVGRVVMLDERDLRVLKFIEDRPGYLTAGRSSVDTMVRVARYSSCGYVIFDGDGVVLTDSGRQAIRDIEARRL